MFLVQLLQFLQIFEKGLLEFVLENILDDLDQIFVFGNNNPDVSQPLLKINQQIRATDVQLSRLLLQQQILQQFFLLTPLKNADFYRKV
jgi:hypothetical protein